LRGFGRRRGAYSLVGAALDGLSGFDVGHELVNVVLLRVDRHALAPDWHCAGVTALFHRLLAAAHALLLALSGADEALHGRLKGGVGLKEALLYLVGHLGLGRQAPQPCRRRRLRGQRELVLAVLAGA
jgi:hypothetical protein